MWTSLEDHDSAYHIELTWLLDILKQVLGLAWQSSG